MYDDNSVISDLIVLLLLSVFLDFETSVGMLMKSALLNINGVFSVVALAI